jgi:large subunit ribosomal protein L13
VATYTPKKSEIERTWHLVDAEGLVLGRMATEVAKILRGRHKPTYAPHIDTGDHVIVINADKIKTTGRKLEQKMYYRHSTYPGGFKSQTLKEMLTRSPEKVLYKAVKGMLPKNRLSSRKLKRLRIYAAPEHPHTAQKPEVMEF